MSEDKTELRMPCEVYTRVVGYLRPQDTFNAGKQQEVKERVEFDPAKAEREQ
jgi:ribonucleoside-triphosphate reductase